MKSGSIIGVSRGILGVQTIAHLLHGQIMMSVVSSTWKTLSR